MAKRKRLAPAQPGYLAGPSDGVRAPETKSMPLAGRASGAPIAQVAAEAATNAALNEMVEAVETARARGLIVTELPLAVIADRYLVRDRLEQNEDEMAALIDSLRARGQQTPIEVTELADPAGGRTHGLISGWRRLSALQSLFEETGEEKFATVKALVIRPETAQDAYVSMVEENEIRVNLSFYERARIAVRAMHEGVYPTQRTALKGLFANVTRSKRSKIGSFIAVVEALDSVLRFPSAISEKLGLALAREITRDPDFAEPLKACLRAGNRDTAGAEMQILADAVATSQKPAVFPQLEPDQPNRPRIRATNANPDERHVTQAAAGVRMMFTPGRNRIELDGDGVTKALMEDLKDWLRHR